MKYLKQLGLTTLILIKAFWKSTVEIAWGIAGLILFGGMMLQYDVSPTIVEELFKLNRYLMNNWMWFWLGFLILYLYDNWWRIREANYTEGEKDE